jgi:endonuclease/exonuclease/phosphatase family metal-dependent hydrolase
LSSCTTPPKTEKEAVPKKPEITIQIASINLANLNKRIERSNIIELVKILKSEQVDILAVQGISRYPGVASRVDFVNELSAKIDWRNVFGEMLNISGRQTGNAIFSVYPILSHQNFSWEQVVSSSFDAVLQATVDAGARPLTVVSTQLPPKATANERAQCLKLIAAMNPDTANQFTIVAGNLPSEDIIHTTNLFTEVSSPEFAKSTISRIWYSTNTSLQLFASRSVETELGTLVIAQFGLLRQQNH